MDRVIINPNYIRFDVSNDNYNKLDRNSNNNYNQLNQDSNLPPGWTELIEPVTGKKYYACHITKHTQWLNPTIPIGTIMDNGLPYGWEKGYDDKTKKYYYINHVGRFNTWNPPIKQRSYLGYDYIW